MKIRNYIGYAVVASLLAITVGCMRETYSDTSAIPSERRPANLSITLSASDIAAAIKSDTRNIINSDGDDVWSEEELLADGRTIRRLTVMLVDSISREMVAYRHIIYDGADSDVEPIHTPLLHGDDDSEGGNGFVGADGRVDLGLKHSDKVRLTFNYDHPLHGDIERLKHGKYVIIAMANYGSLPVDASQDDGSVDHPSVKDKNGFVKQIHAVIHRFYGDDDMKLSDDVMRDPEFLRTGGRGVKEFGSSLAGFYDYVLSVAKDKDGNQPFIRKKLDELPLFTVGYIDLQPGDNFLTDPIYLYRTYARVRVEVKNYSTEPLSVYDLKFSDNFSKDRTYFCRMPGATNVFDGLDYTPGAPDVSYGESIIAFPYYNTSTEGEPLSKDKDKCYIVSDNDLTRNEIGTGQPVIKQGQTAAIFDAYISASRDDKDDKYRYEIELGYPDIGERYVISSQQVSAVAVDECYVIGSGNNWICESLDGRVQMQNTTLDDIAAQIESGDMYCLWLLQKSGTGYRLQNVATGNYVSVTRSGNQYILGLTYLDSGAETFTVSGNGAFTLRSTTSNYYVRYSNSALSLSNRYSTAFAMYSAKRSQGMSKRVEVVLQTIDNQTSAVTDVKEICRNDFVHILVEVSYNPDKGDFQFEVQPWNTGKGGEITFN